MIGFALNALREAVYGSQSDRLLLVRYESLVANPLGTLAAIYAFLGKPLHPHDPAHIEPCYDMIEFDQRLGTPGLHDVGRAVHALKRPTILPPDLFARYETNGFLGRFETATVYGDADLGFFCSSARPVFRPEDRPPAKGAPVWPGYRLDKLGVKMGDKAAYPPQKRRGLHSYGAALWTSKGAANRA